MGAEQARAAVSLLASRPGFLREAAEAGFDVLVVDLGRLDPGSPVERLLADLDVLLVTSRAGAHDLSHVAGRGTVLAEWRHRHGGPGAVGLVLTGPCRYRLDDIEEAAGLPVMARLPHDDDSADALRGGSPGKRWSPRGQRPLIAALRDLAERLGAAAPPRVSSTPVGQVSDAPAWAVVGSPGRPSQPESGQRRRNPWVPAPAEGAEAP